MGETGTMKVRKVDFYPDDWLVGCALLSPDERGVYVTLVMLMYSRGHGLEDSDEHLAKLCNMHVRSFRAVLGRLKEASKVVETELKGCRTLSHSRVEAELTRARTRTEKARNNGRNGGEASAKTRSQSNENKDIAEPDASTLASHGVQAKIEAHAGGILQPSTINQHSRAPDSDPPKAPDPDERERTIQAVCQAANIELDGPWRAGFANRIDLWVTRGATLTDCVAGVQAAMSKKRAGWSPNSAAFFDMAVEDEAEKAKRSATRTGGYPAASAPPDLPKTPIGKLMGWYRERQMFDDIEKLFEWQKTDRTGAETWAEDQLAKLGREQAA